MWTALRDARTAAPATAVSLLEGPRAAFDDWSDRTTLSHGVHADPNAGATLFYVNTPISVHASHVD